MRPESILLAKLCEIAADRLKERKALLWPNRSKRLRQAAEALQAEAEKLRKG